MTTNLTELAFREDATLSVVLRAAVDGNSHLDADTVADLQEHGVMLEYLGVRYFVPWSNVAAIKETVV